MNPIKHKEKHVTMKMVLPLVLAFCLLLPCSSIIVLAEEGNISENVQYDPNSYDEKVLNILDDELILELQDLIDTEISENPNITEDELNIKIMDYITQQYAAVPTPYGYLPQYESSLNSAEKSLYASNPVKGTFALSCAINATNTANSLFVSDALYLGNGDAFRHAYWCGLITDGYGASYAKQWGDAHESNTPAGIDKTMDLRNNQSGINIASGITGPYFAPRFQQELLSQISSGKLVRIVNNKLVATNGTGRK